MSSQADDEGFAETVRRRFADVNTVMTVTNESPRPPTVGAHRAATRIASILGARLVFADNTQATWGDTPHIRGPADIEVLQGLGISYMVEQLQGALDGGAVDVRAVAPSMPSLDGFDDAVHTSGADLIILPTKLDHTPLAARWQLGGDFLTKLRTRTPGVRIVLADEDGRLLDT